MIHRLSARDDNWPNCHFEQHSGEKSMRKCQRDEMGKLRQRSLACRLGMTTDADANVT
jgi:hypothetical protein